MTTIHNAVSNLPTHTELQSIANHLRNAVVKFEEDSLNMRNAVVKFEEDSLNLRNAVVKFEGVLQELTKVNFSDKWGGELLSEINSVIQENEFEGKLFLEEKKGTKGSYKHIWKKDKTKGIILEQHNGSKAKEGLLTSSHRNGGGKLLKEWRDASALGWTEKYPNQFIRTSGERIQRMQFDLRGKPKEDFRKILRLIHE